MTDPVRRRLVWTRSAVHTAGPMWSLIDLIPFAIIFLAYFIRGITGFGSGLVAVPLLAHFLPLQTVVPMVLILDFTAAIVLSGHLRNQVQWMEIRPLIPTTLAGILIGATLLVKIPAQPLLLALGLLILVFGIRYLFDIHGEAPVSRLWAVPAGFVGGLVGSLFGTGGPPYVVYLGHRIPDKARLRATLSGLFMLDGTLRLVSFAITGLLLQAGLGKRLLYALPLLALGLYSGHRVHLGIARRQLMMLIGALLVVSGVSLVWKAWN